MKSLLILSLLLTTALSATLHDILTRDLFHQWKQAHNKAYNSLSEEEFRFQTFLQNYQAILAFNNEQDDVVLALNDFADLTPDEFSMFYTGTFLPEAPENIKEYYVKDLPKSVDWRSKGAVTAVKNQGKCGSCWSFSATGALEGLYYLNSSKLVAFSEQNIVDCSKTDHGCGGGLHTRALNYTALNGIETEEDYPYVAKTQECAQDASKAITVNSGYYNVTPKDPEQLKAALVGQPVSVGIQANDLVFQFYRSGVIKRMCGDIINHAVLVVGYDVVKGTEAFIVKNSWGPKWGVDGYVYISTDGTPNRGKGVCGILFAPAAPYKD